MATRRSLATSLALLLTACGTGAPAQPDIEAPGTIELNQADPADVPLGGGGTGTVFFRGRIYRFSIGGDGLYASAVALLQTSGNVHRLGDISRLPGTYRRTPNTPGTPGQSGDGLWLQNERSTAVIHLNVPPGGRMPDIHTDALTIVLDQ